MDGKMDRWKEKKTNIKHSTSTGIAEKFEKITKKLTMFEDLVVLLCYICIYIIDFVFIGEVGMPHHHLDQMSQRSQEYKLVLRRSSLNVFVVVIV